MMHAFTCPGLPASWVNAWLAAVGATVLDPRIRLHWTVDGAPVAVLSSVEIDPIEALVESWPDEALLRDLPVAQHWNGAGELRRKVPVKQFVARVKEARGHPFAWTLSSTMTDLSIDKNGEVAHAPFDPPVPRGFTLHDRLLTVHREAALASGGRLRDSLVGKAERVAGNGLGFSSRTRRPPRDPVNAMLSFCYGLLVTECTGALESVGLDYQMGFFHRPRAGRPSLALDLAEELRALTDRFVVSPVRRRQVGADSFNHTPGGGVYLSDDARTALIKAWEDHKETELPHRILGRPVGRWAIPSVQATLLARHLRRDLAAYPPFVLT